MAGIAVKREFKRGAFCLSVQKENSNSWVASPLDISPAFASAQKTEQP